MCHHDRTSRDDPPPLPVTAVLACDPCNGGESGVSALLTLFLDLCRLRAAPQDLPASRTLLWASALAAIVSAPPGDEGVLSGWIAAGLQVALLGLFVHTLLGLQNLPERWDQTGTAVFGTTALINLMAWPIVLWYYRVPEPEAAFIPSLLGVLLSCWYIAVLAHILRHALELGLGAALMLSVGCMLLLLAVTLLVFPNAIT